jgi:hypothetical protein
MDFEALKAWLARQTRKQIRIRWLLALLGVVLTPIALVVDAFLIFVIVRRITRDWDDPQMNVKCLWVTLGIIPVLFVINRFMDRGKGTEKYYHDEPDTSVTGSYWRVRKAEAGIFLWVLFTGPRLVDWVIFSLRQIRQLTRQDTHSCAAVLWLLVVKAKRTAYPDLQRELDWLDVEATLPQLAWISGVLYIKTTPPAVSLTDDLRNAIRAGEAIP